MTDWFLEGYGIAPVEPSRPSGQWDGHVRGKNLMLANLPWICDLEIKREYGDLMDGSTRVSAWEDSSANLSLEAKLPLGGLWYYDLAPGFASQFDTLDLECNGEEPPI
jgi:hypothetical protein